VDTVLERVVSKVKPPLEARARGDLKVVAV
jgi:hypothetical protein